MSQRISTNLMFRLKWCRCSDLITPCPITTDKTIYRTELKTYAHSNNSPDDVKFTFPLAKTGKISAKELFEWFHKKGFLRYKTDKDGNGCFLYAKKSLKEMEKDGWFESKSELIKKNFDKIDSFGKDTVIGDSFITYGKGTFF